MAPRPQGIRSVTTSDVAPRSRPGSEFNDHSPLISGLVLKEKPREQLRASEVILKAVKTMAHAFTAHRSYMEELVKLAEQVKDPVKEDNQVADKPPESTRTKKPRTKEEALLIVLRRNGLKPQDVTEDRVSEEYTYYAVDVGGQKQLIPVGNFVMREEDPLAAVERTTSMFRLGPDLSEAKRRLTSQSKPELVSVIPLGIKQEDLDNRMVSYEGERFFTYYGNEGNESTFVVPLSNHGKDLLGYIDMKIADMHMSSGRPFVAEVLEKQLEGSPGMEWVDERIRTKAKVLDHLARQALPASMVPERYRDAVAELKESRHLRKLNGCSIESEKFMEAFASLDHPAHVKVRILNRNCAGPDGGLSKDAARMIRELLEREACNLADVAEPALRNLAEAYAIVTLDWSVAQWDEETLRRNHFKMMYAIERSVRKLSNKGTIEPVFGEDHGN